MESVFDRIERMIRKERIIKVATGMAGGTEPWACPLQLNGGVDYSISASAGSGAAVKCALINGNAEEPLVEGEAASEISLFVTPDEDGIYTLMVGTGPTSSLPRKITVKVRKAYVPSRARAWGYPWTRE
jgi:hypothetical protein